jgi:hypothetical protein
MRKLLVLIALVLCPALSAGKIDKKLPDPTNLRRYGCVVNGPVWRTDYNDPQGRKRKVWVLTVWAAHQGPSDKKATKDWKLWYSDRTKRAKALTDCDKWMERVAKKIKASRAR